MTTCSTNACGVGGWGGPLPGDPDNNSILSATPAFGGIDVSWTYPGTNPEAVAHVILYRGVSASFNSAIVIATVGGNFFYDKSTSPQLIEYYYWITIVSVNGTVGAPIGPASAVAKPPIASVIEGLTAQIDAGLLAQSLRTEIDKITLNYAELTAEIANRISSNSALSAALADVQSGVAQSLAFVNQEITQRQEGDLAVVTQLNTVAAVNAQNTAAILTEQTARVNADSALATSITTVAATAGGKNRTYSQNAAPTGTLVAGDLWFDTDDNKKAYRYNGSSWVATDDTRIAGTAAALVTEQTARATADSALATQITTAQTTLDGNISSVQVTLQSNIDTLDGKVTIVDGKVETVDGRVTTVDGKVETVDGKVTTIDGKVLAIGARYTAVVSVNGLIGGFGVYNDGTTVQAGFDVDEFWVGKTQANKRKPFIISGGVTYIDDAAIEKLTFTKLRDASGSVVIENGKIKANYLQVNEIYGGDITGWGWPVAGQSKKGFYLGPNGLLIGNANDNRYFYADVNGDVSAPGFSIVNGSATFSGTLTANIVNTNNIVGNAVTAGYAAQTTGTSVVVTVSNPSGATCMLVIVQAGDPVTVVGGSGENTETTTYYPTATININGANVSTGYTTITHIATTVPSGNFNVTALRPNGSVGILKLFVLVTKR